MTHQATAAWNAEWSAGGHPSDRAGGHHVTVPTRFRTGPACVGACAYRGLPERDSLLLNLPVARGSETAPGMWNARAAVDVEA